MATIPQRELRNNVSDVLRRAEGGERFTVTVHGRPVAELGPVARSRPPATPASLSQIIADTPVDPQWHADLERLRDEDRATAREPWAS